MNRTAVSATLVGVLGVARAATPPVDLDANDGTVDTSKLLAESSGVCAKANPAFMKWACPETPNAAVHRTFVKRYHVTAPTVDHGVVTFAIPIQEYGKGYLFSITQPEIQCNATTCLYHPTNNVYVKTTLDAATVATIAAVKFTFEVHALWKMNQWWSPRPSSLAATFFDEHDKRLGEGTVFEKVASP